MRISLDPGEEFAGLWPLAAIPLAAIDRLAGRIGVPYRLLSATELMAAAQRRTGLNDFGEEPFQEPLRVLIGSYEEDAQLSLFGRIAARWDALRYLSNLLLIRAGEKRDPGIAEQRIEQPIFITGMPRSGTTFLHHLLSLDAANLSVRCWETIYPCASENNHAGPDPRPGKVERHLNGFARLAPEIRSIHPIQAQSPQECTEITGHVFQSLRFDTTHRVPGYSRWLDGNGHVAAFRFHRRFLRHLQHQGRRGRWILKCPDHVFALEAIRRVYPDARFVFLHRNPLEVLPSVARLTEVLRRPFTRSLDRTEIGSQVSERWTRGAAILVDTVSSPPGTPDQVAHLAFTTLTTDPIGTVAALYERFGLPFGADFSQRLRQATAQWPQSSHAHRKVRLEDYGLQADTVRQLYRDYIACFGV